ncbi:HD domain-containing protein [Candidatus Woesearchaeota archaeon]|nr:HD domain-containing protein [Candidatus Woesearchaeota archaeon]
MIDKNPNYKELYEEVCKLYDKTKHFKHGPWDETYFTLRVFESAKDIMNKLKEKNFDKETILVAAILHDIGKIKVDMESVIDYSTSDCFDKPEFSREWRKHPILGVPLAKKIMRKFGYSEKFIEKVCCLVKNHANRKKDFIPSLNLQILQDADIIADCGYAGFIRPFLFGGKFSYANVIGSIKYIQKEKHRVEKKGFLNLDVSKEIAEKKMKLQKRLIKEISKEIKSELL